MSRLKKEVIGKWVFKIASLFFIFLGFFLNWHTVSRLLYGVDILPASQKIFISVIDACSIFVGYLFWRFRNNFEKQINFLLLFLTITVCFLTTEWILHMVSSRSISHPIISLFTENCPTKGLYCVKPNVDIKSKFGFDEVKIKTKSFGMAGKEISIENLSNRKRVALLGDSNTFGFWASSFENSFAGKITEALDENHFEILNFGVPGHGQVHQEVLLKEQIIKFKPSYVILFFTNANDMRDNYLGKDMYIITKEGTAAINGKIYKEKMNITEKKEFVAPEKNKLFLKIKDNVVLKTKNIIMAIRNSYVYTYGYSFFAKSLILSKNPIDLNNFMSSIYWSRSDYTEIAHKAKDETIEKINDISIFCKEKNIKLLIISIPFYEQVYYKSSIGPNYNIMYPQKYIEDYAKSKNIFYLDLLPRLREYARNNPNEKLYNEDNLHFNDNGHNITASLTFDFLKNKFLPY